MFEHNYYHLQDISQSAFLVTGGAGFIGSNLVDYLLKHGAGHVRVLDNFSTGFHSNITSFLSNPRFELIEGDIRDITTCQHATNNIDFVLHQAALGSVQRSVLDPVTTNAVNISGFLNMLVAAKEARVNRIVYASSSSVYGDSKDLPKVENHIGTPLSPYATTKVVNEIYAGQFSRLYAMNIIGLRYFNVFGPKQSPLGEYAAVIPKFILQILNNEEVIINGDGTYSRDFTFIENVIQANIRALFSDIKNDVFNVAYGNKVTLNELIEHITNQLSIINYPVGKIQLLHRKERAGDIPHSLASINKTVELLGYHPVYDLEKGLQKTIQWFLENYV